MARWKVTKEDKEFAEASDIIIETLVDADQVTGIEIMTGNNVRDQLTVDEIDSMYTEAQDRRKPKRW